MTPDDRYPCIEADPPWDNRGGGKSKRGAQAKYPTLKAHQIIEVMLNSPLWRPADNCHLWMWALAQLEFFEQALFIMRALGFRPVTQSVWVKAVPLSGGDAPDYGNEDEVVWRPGPYGTGQYVRMSHEHLLLGVRGRLAGASKVSRSTIWAPRQTKGKSKRTEHSKKPPQAYQMIESISPGPRASLFATGPREGWDTWRGVGHNGEGECTWTASGSVIKSMSADRLAGALIDTTGVPEDEKAEFVAAARRPLPGECTVTDRGDCGLLIDGADPCGDCHLVTSPERSQ